MEVRNAKDAPKIDESTRENCLDKEKEKVLRYIAGYVPFALLKKLKKYSNTAAIAFCKFLNSWEVAGSGYSKTFLDSIELVSRVFLTHKNLVKMQGVNIKAVLANRMFTNKLVQDYWSNLIRDKLNADSSKKLFDMVVNFYIKIRCKPFIKVYLNIKKMNSKSISKKAEKALRKNLDEDKEK
ncbi:uncharacterized protein LOC110990240 [Acanthaster planci]|uniref:Uncharacterized protein LOC110990240 n=1 Tax=Acanthaster planci TaxID=133434 RepID=A0A8B7ZZ73_ACAPL|nr:uncharacterized protein LOC110990240 [Acanthaster planci]